MTELGVGGDVVGARKTLRDTRLQVRGLEPISIRSEKQILSSRERNLMSTEDCNIKASHFNPTGLVCPTMRTSANAIHFIGCPQWTLGNEPHLTSRGRAPGAELDHLSYGISIH